ncbi:hypothetical protein ADUPG1_006350 [Aduncisulcus paluster]|uniref:Uncharacterized protein n=1 Tax=Aduncisulcus paluster TaxID=2918883 RepID=A0ABQ5KHX8_9EUKA|nr:hypothetical protein ADUPG1_006350 [Aduncisulcus paluster]
MAVDERGQLVVIDLSLQERELIRGGLLEWGGSASYVPFPIEVLGIHDWPEFDGLTSRLRVAIEEALPLSDLDWARVLLLTEICFASSLIGSGLDFPIVTGIPDQEAITTLRSLQRKIGSSHRAGLLFPNAGRPRAVDTA